MPEESKKTNLEDLLRKDAGRITELPLDLKLQRETMRIIRGLKSEKPVARPLFLIGSVAAVFLILATAGFLMREDSPENRSLTSHEGAPASFRSYHLALMDSEDALLESLSRDGGILLPKSRDVFLVSSY